MNKQKGFTLIELLMTLSLFGIVFGFAVPSFTQFIHKASIRSATMTLVHAVAIARESAVVGGRPISICPTEDGRICTKKWQQRFMIYEDLNGNSVQDEDETKVVAFMDVGNKWRIDWRAFGGKSHITFTPEGYTRHQNGSFKICSTQDVELGRLVIVNKPGRARVGPDSDRDGYSEKYNGENMQCLN